MKHQSQGDHPLVRDRAARINSGTLTTYKANQVPLIEVERRIFVALDEIPWAPNARELRDYGRGLSQFSTADLQLALASMIVRRVVCGHIVSSGRRLTTVYFAARKNHAEVRDA